ncbi:MAG TPA: hypothetical protein VGD34_12840 [Kribbella sp.]
MPLVDLDDPAELRARWSALAAVAHATGFDRRWYADERGWYHQDETGSDLRLIRLDDQRAVLFGFHTQHSHTAAADLLAGSPDWIGEAEVRQRIAAGQLGFVYGSFNGTWARASYPGDPWQPLDDGFAPIAQWVTSDEEAAREMIEWAAEWADYLGGLDELLPIGIGVIRTAASSGLSADSLKELFDRLGIDPRSPQQPDLRAGLQAAAEFGEGIVAAGAQPAVPFDEPEEEESFYVPPGVSPFTGQPIGPEISRIGEPYATDSDDYGVVEKKPRRFGRKNTEEEEGDPLARLGLIGPEPEVPEEPSPEQFLGDQRLPSAEPPRVGGPMEDGEDFYASLFADSPAAATYTPDVRIDAPRDWSSDDTGVIEPLLAEPQPPAAADAQSAELVGAVEDELTDDEPTAEIAAVVDDAEPEDEYYPTTTSPFAPPPDPAEPQPAEHKHDHELGGEFFHDEIIGDADWTADQLAAEPGPEPHAEAPFEAPSEAYSAPDASSAEQSAVEVTAQLEAIRDDEPEPPERPAEEKLVAPPASSGPVIVPGLGLVGADLPRIEPAPGSIEEAMRSEFERPRPRPRESPAFQALREWCRARTRIVPSGFTIQVQVVDPARPSYRFDLEPPDVDDPQYGAEQLGDLLGDLWEAESQGEQGGWLFARLDAAGRTLRIDRWYDQVPDWWDHPIEPRLDVHGLVRRLNGRGPDWQPSYLEKLYTTVR